MMVTLMACYGAGYYGEDGYDPNGYDSEQPTEPCVDYDVNGQCGPPAEPVCGDGVLGGVEACDDGNLVGGDGCDGACRVELCAASEPLEAAEVAGDTKDGSARFHVDCGDYHGLGHERVFAYEVAEPGVLALRLEGGAQLGLYVTSTCSAIASVSVTDAAGAAGCAAPDPDGPTLSVALQPGSHWVVVDGAVDGDFGAPFLLHHTFTPACGDGELQPWAGEECDDGNRDAGDGCDAVCRLES